MSHVVRYLIVLALSLMTAGASASASDRVTILYDAFGDKGRYTRDWGFSALIEYDGKRILFDTGNNAEIFARNIRQARVDLTRLDFVVLSHRHLDHTAGLAYVLRMNSRLQIFAPAEIFGIFGSELGSGFYRTETLLPSSMRYFGGTPPPTLTFGSAWPSARFTYVSETKEVIPGVFLIASVSDKPGTKELRELSLAIVTSKGIALITGCSHPGIENIARAAQSLGHPLYLVAGGFHLPAASDAEIGRIASILNDDLRVEYVAPGHCTGEPAFARMRTLWRERYIYAGVGSIYELPRSARAP